MIEYVYVYAYVYVTYVRLFVGAFPPQLGLVHLNDFGAQGPTACGTPGSSLSRSARHCIQWGQARSYVCEKSLPLGAYGFQKWIHVAKNAF